MTMIQLLVLSTSHQSADLSPDCLILDPSRTYSVTFGDPAIARMAEAESERLRQYPHLRGDAQPPPPDIALKHVKLPPTHDPIRDISAWLHANGAKWHEQFQVLHGSNVILVFNLHRYKSAEAA